jgi:aspartate beta-hydroxylase
VQRLAYVAAACPVLPEPCLWLASEAAADGDGPQALTWQAEAERRAEQLGTGWDKRVRRDAWPQIAQAGHRPDDDDRAAARFSDHLEALAARPRAPYPGLTARPFWDPRAVPLAQTLSRHAPAIIAEIRQLDATRFQPEAERIGRTGSWDVVFLYDRGRRHDDVCRALPTLARIVDADPSTIRSPAGLVYVSRMRAGTHIAAHRGPTNVRLRCHLGITVPPGDCAIRVERETRPWRTAECLVLDDHFEHEAWNHTDEDRIVVIADLWHPELSPREIELLSALDRHTAHAARRLAAYWRNNDAAQRG